MTLDTPAPAAGFDGYFVTMTGSVFSERRGSRRELRQSILKSGGYPVVALRRDDARYGAEVRGHRNYGASSGRWDVVGA